VVQHQRFESLYPRKNRIVRDQTSHVSMDGGGGLQRVWGLKAMRGTDPGCDVRDFEVRKG
jgi:hypothetical protein